MRRERERERGRERKRERENDLLTGGSRKFDDFREAYKWLSENTAEVGRTSESMFHRIIE